MRTTKPDKYSRTLRRAYQDFKAGDLSLATLSMIIRAVQPEPRQSRGG